jgi:iron complex outermembrane receptor protein
VRAFETPKTQTSLRASTLSYAAYGQATFDVTERLKLTAGLRFTQERKRIFRRQMIQNVSELRSRAGRNGFDLNLDVNPALNDGANPSIFFEFSDRFSKFTPAANIQYFLTDDINVYLNYSRGFKSGGFNGRADDPEDNTFFDPEILTSYEAGIKSQWFDNRLTLNAAYFQSTYRDIQLTVVTNNNEGNLVVFTDNAGKAQINGAEIEIRGVVLPGLELSSGGSITAARYKEFDREGFSNVKLPNTPTYTFNVAAAYGFSLGDLGDVLTRVSWRHEGEKSSDVADPRFTRVSKHGTLGARIALTLADGQTEFALFGSNLLNREYFSNAIDLSGSLGTTLRYYAPPRNFGLELRRNF